MDIADSSPLLNRVKRLETQVRVWQILGILVVLLFGYSHTASVMAQQGARHNGRSSEFSAKGRFGQNYGPIRGQRRPRSA